MEDREFDEFIGKEFDPNPCIGQKAEGFDPVPHILKNFTLRCGRVLFPDVRELRKLYLMTCEALHVAPIETNSAMANRYPPPQETAPTRVCPNCGLLEYRLYSICSGCDESEKGQFKTKWWCYREVRAPKTGEITEKFGCKYQEKSDKFLTQWYNELKIEFGNQTKESLGVKTITNEGLK